VGLKERFIARLPFEPDPFQLEAMEALDKGHSVVVAAPTGSGKTLVAEYAVEKALAAGGKAFYTTPLKALSNQKFADFGARYGAARVGLLTGDNSINGEAPVVVMTTEVLRNMIYAGSPALEGLRYVVLDEVHYLQDPYRGPVWEEVIIHLPAEVDLVCLSATISNAEELAAWVGTVRGSTRAVIEEKRPVPLHNLFCVGDRRSGGLVVLPTLVEGRPNPEGSALVSGTSGERWKAHARQRQLFGPRRAEVLDLLRERGFLPTIYFIFSRAGCDEAVRQMLRDHGRLTNPAERRQIRELAEQAAAGLSGTDLSALGFGEWLAALEAGFAAHHAGMVPTWKEVVERCFIAGLVKVVFATETLSLGINMPARSVVIERLSKFGGERTEALTPGEYTQLTGRAGRRGIDEVGYALVLWSPGVSFEQVAALAGARSYTLASSFRPTYNMATNLVRRSSPEQARHLLNLSFAQYRSDADIVRLERELERAELALLEAREGAECELGDVFEYREILYGGAAAAPQVAEVRSAMERLRPGDVLSVAVPRPGGGRGHDRVAVLSTRQRKKGDLAVRAITARRRLVTFEPRDLHAPPVVLGRVELPSPYAPTRRSFQRQVAASLEALRLGRRRRPREPLGHPVESCPQLRAHLRSAAQVARLTRQVEAIKAQVTGRSESLARQFDRVLKVLEDWGYVKGWALTASGERLSRIYHPQDLLVAECAERGLLDGLRPAEMAALVSVFTYEARGPAPSTVARLPNSRLERRWEQVEKVALALNESEQAAGLPLTRLPDAGFAQMAYAWARGEELSQLLLGGSPAVGRDDRPGRGGRRRPSTRGRRRPQDGLGAVPAVPAVGAVPVVPTVGAGDFVRNIKQLSDLLRQLAEVLPDPSSAEVAAKTANLLFRGIVAASSVVEVGEDTGWVS
jgi:ATP-dependent RNA helicase HelY